MKKQCAICGYDKNPRILQVHHLLPRNYELPDHPGRFSTDDRLEVVLLCPNCHAELHLEMQERLGKEPTDEQLWQFLHELIWDRGLCPFSLGRKSRKSIRNFLSGKKKSYIE